MGEMISVTLPFADRFEAGGLLADELAGRQLAPNAVVFGLARGGVPVGFEVADRLGLPLDVVVARKIGVPWQPELAMGAMAGSFRVLNAGLIETLAISEAQVAEIVEREQAEVARREALYRGGRPPLALQGKTAILVDDGLATGATMLASVRYVRTLRPRGVIVAVPVGSEDGCVLVRSEVDQLICLAIPESFIAVGEWYRDFSQTADDEVRNLLSMRRHGLSRKPRENFELKD
jgi:putative phosphoribosyl transferase